MDSRPTDSPAPKRGLFKTACDCLEAPPNNWIARCNCYTWLVIATACIGAFIGQIDASIVQLALPELERQFDCGLDAVSWVAIGYLLAFAAFLPPFARLSEITGRKRLYICGYALFTLASALCGFAPNLPSLIALRVVQGIGGSLLGANGVVILVKIAGPARQGRAMGIFAAAQAVGVGVGPALGGLLINTLSWHWVFWIVVPFGFVATVGGWLILPQTPAVPAKAPFDWGGALLLCPALTAILLVLSESHGHELISVGTVIWIVAAGVLLWFFIRQERKAPAPLISLSLLRVPAFAAGIAGVLLSYGLLYAMFFLMSFAFVRGAHESPLEAGLRLATIPITLGLVAPIAGVLSERTGARALAFAGMVACFGGSLLTQVALRNELSNPVEATLGLVLFGAGLGLYISPNNSSTLSAAPAASAGIAGGLLNLMRVLGTSVGVATAASALSWRLEARPNMPRSLSAEPADILFAATREAMYMLLAFAVVAGIAALVKPAQKLKATG